MVKIEEKSKSLKDNYHWRDHMSFDSCDVGDLGSTAIFLAQSRYRLLWPIFNTLVGHPLP